MSDVFIISAVRSPLAIGRIDGALASINSINLTTYLMLEVLKRAGVEPRQVEEVIWGCANPIEEQGANLARLASLKAGFPVEVPALTLNCMGGLSQQAIHFAAQAILSGEMDVVIAGGTEVMPRTPMGSHNSSSVSVDFPKKLDCQLEYAERMAEKWQLSRAELDDFSYQSHQHACQAIQNGFFISQILSISLPDGRVIQQDEGVCRIPTRQELAELPPLIKEGGVVTAGNSCQIGNGSAALILASAKAVGRYNLMPLARIVACTVTGSNPVLMLDGVIPATYQILKRSHLTLEEIDIFEINETFASVVLAWEKELQPNSVRINPNGGAIGLGHPLGASGAILMTKLIYELIRQSAHYGLQTMSNGHGMASATILERV